jgi:hypothetical protein
MINIQKREISLKRAKELKSSIDDYLQIKDTLKKGTSAEQNKKIIAKKIAYYLTLMQQRMIGRMEVAIKKQNNRCKHIIKTNRP